MHADFMNLQLRHAVQDRRLQRNIRVSGMPAVHHATLVVTACKVHAMWCHACLKVGAKPALAAAVHVLLLANKLRLCRQCTRARNFALLYHRHSHASIVVIDTPITSQPTAPASKQPSPINPRYIDFWPRLTLHAGMHMVDVLTATDLT
jgi:hypothetical protein